MPRDHRRPLVPLVAAALLLALGAGVAWGVGGALGLSWSPALVPAEPRVSTPEAGPPVPPPAISAIEIPDDARLSLAAEALATAVAGRQRPKPAIVHGSAGGPGTLRVTLGASLGGSPESYRLAGPFDLRAAGVAGAAAGLYRLADQIRSGAAVVADGAVVAPRLGLRLTDAGSVGREPDPAVFAAGTDYSLNTDVVGTALLDHAPWVDPAAVDRIAGEFRQFVNHSLAQGYNGVLLPGFLEYITFAKVGDGYQVYPAGDVHIARAQAMVAAFTPVFRYAADLGLKVYLLTDMLAVSPPLERYLGDLDTSDPRLWAVYQAGLAELFESMPFVAGLMVRIGEGGDVYQQAGWDYSSKIAVTTDESVRAMLTALLATAASAGKEIIFRTWTVGVGAVGDLHTNPASYDQVLGGFNDPHLIVSTKYSLGDFYSHLPLNDTLERGNQRRIVEFQARREFEGFGSLPNDLTALEKTALQRFLAANPRIEGVWNWTQDGGPLRAGPMSLYLRTGFWQLYDLNTYATARLAINPDTDPAAITQDWIRQTFSDDPRVVTALGQMFALSRTAITKGLYIGPFADNTVKALGLEPPPMMWIFEWDIVTGDSAALDSIYAVVGRDRLDEAIAEGDQAVAVAKEMRDLVAGTAAGAYRDPSLRQQLVETLDYQVDLFGTLGAYRTMVLRHAEWLDTGSSTAHRQWKQAESAFRTAAAGHERTYAGNLDRPAYNFTAAGIGMRRADRDGAMAWAARILLALLAIALLLGTAAGQRWLRKGTAPGAVGLRALWLGATRPWRVASGPVAAGALDRTVVWLIPVLALVASRAIYTWFAAPAHLVLTLGAWALFAAALAGLTRGRDRFHLWAVVGGVALLRTGILLVALVLRGPGRYWFNFWTAPTARSIYITVAFAAFAWLFVATALVLRDRYGWRRRRSVGATLVAIGGPTAVLGTLIAAIGLERALTMWNDQMALLPWGLSRILGITVYLGIPTVLPVAGAVVGAVLVLVGALLSWGRRTGASGVHAAAAG